MLRKPLDLTSKLSADKAH